MNNSKPISIFLEYKIKSNSEEMSAVKIAMNYT